MKRITSRWAVAATPVRGYVRRSETASDKRLSPEARSLLQTLDPAVLPVHLACRFPRIVNQIALLWPTPEKLSRYFDDLLIDKRGDRQGFPAVVVAELMDLQYYYAARTPPKRESVWDASHSARGVWPKLNAKG